MAKVTRRQGKGKGNEMIGIHFFVENLGRVAPVYVCMCMCVHVLGRGTGDSLRRGLLLVMCLFLID
jgi:hypothetical protein